MRMLGAMEFSWLVGRMKNKVIRFDKQASIM